MDYKKYQNARNASWELLVDLKISSLPVKIEYVLEKLEIPFYGYGVNQEIIKDYNLEELANSSDGFTFFKNNKHYIFYNEKLSVKRQRFTLAHELGHVLCNHISSDKTITVTNKEPSENDNEIEQEANVFASRLLSPACVLHELKLFSAQQISEVCQISLQSADFRLKRLLLLEERNKRFLTAKGYGCFYLSPLEKQVYNQFEEYILKNKS